MASIHNLRTFIAALEEAGQLARVRRPVSLVHELADVAATLARSGGGAPLFEAVQGSNWPIFAGGIANQKRAAIALGCAEPEIIDVMARVLEPANGIPPVPVESAVWQANVRTGADADVTQLPLPTHSRGDGGAFITGGVIVSKDPVTGRGNLSYNRMLRTGPRGFGFNVNEWRHVRQFMDSRPDPAAPFPIAVAIGLDPAIMIAAGVRTDEDELTIAGAIRGQGVPVRRGVTVDVDIPAEAEIVIEGLVHPAQTSPEGPLAEFHGYHGELWDSPTVEVTAVCWRDAPIFQTIIPGWYEHIYIGNVLPREPLLRKFVRHINPTANVHIPPYSNGFSAIVQMRRDNPGQPKNLALAAMTAHVNIKNVIVVDEDVNIYDPADVLWALTNRVDWSLDIFTVPGSQGHEMDPTANQRGVHTKIGIDATYKRERREYGSRVSYPPVDLSEYLNQ
ncbi:MAG: UbiD family decarboxylase [Chloroflexi bacterium]|nr:MAG: UbiD family decarboxylase [Chloroflexota bacterium]